MEKRSSELLKKESITQLALAFKLRLLWEKGFIIMQGFETNSLR